MAKENPLKGGFPLGATPPFRASGFGCQCGFSAAPHGGSGWWPAAPTMAARPMACGFSKFGRLLQPLLQPSGPHAKVVFPSQAPFRRGFWLEH